MANGQDSTLRIFLSSTAIDMMEYRKQVENALLRLENLPVSMEYFGAMPNEPVEACKEKVRSSDALVVMLAHRYGWVPTEAEKGDGKKSITWIEVETALADNIPVFAFIVDDKFGWTQPKEQDQLVNARTPEEIANVIKNVQSLAEFKAFISSKAGLVRDTFTTADNLAMKVSTSIGAHSQPSRHSARREEVKEIPLVFRLVHPLQPAPHFRGRKQLLADLKKWWDEPVTPDRVRSLVAIGGTGKTAIAERFIASIKNEKLKGSVLVWSFYEDPNTDAFLKEACIVFTGQEPEGISGRLEYLQRALSSQNRQNLLVLDGLERVQSGGKGNERTKGDIENFVLKNLLRSIASGLGNTRALITSRFKLTDLAQWEGAGYRSVDLEVLDPESAVEVLKAWKVKGTDEELGRLAKSVGFHALSVSVIGSYLNHYGNGNIEGAKEFKLEEMAVDEPLAARLKRVLGSYAKSLSNQERDFLVRLSVFQNGVSIDILGYVIDAGGEIAGTLISIDQGQLVKIAKRLMRQGLVYTYNEGNASIYTAHPFLREYFRALLGVPQENIHEVVMNKLAFGLDAKPKNQPNDTETLDKYEQLIEYSILAGHYKEAYYLYWNVMGGGGGQNHLYHTLGDYGRLIRIMSAFAQDGTPATLSCQLEDINKLVVVSGWGNAAASLGDLKTAYNSFCLHFQLARQLESTNEKVQSNTSISYIALLQGLFPDTAKISQQSLNFISDKEEDSADLRFIQKSTHSYIGFARHCAGEVPQAKEEFSKASYMNDGPLYSISGFLEISHLLQLGYKAQALQRVNENLKFSEVRLGPRDISFSHYQLGIALLPESVAESRNHLQKIREWTGKSGHMECIILSHNLAAEISYCSQDYPAAIFEAKIGLNHAEGCGYGKYTIDLLLQLAKINLSIPDYTTALGFARKALDLSAKPECSYAWGQADGLHWCGVCHKGLGEYALARQRLTAAVEIRAKIEHPGLEETRRVLAELP